MRLLPAHGGIVVRADGAGRSQRDRVFHRPGDAAVPLVDAEPRLPAPAPLARLRNETHPSAAPVCRNSWKVNGSRRAPPPAPSRSWRGRRLPSQRRYRCTDHRWNARSTGDLGADHGGHRRDDVEPARGRIDDQECEGGEAVERLQGVDGLDRQHQRCRASRGAGSPTMARYQYWVCRKPPNQRRRWRRNAPTLPGASVRAWALPRTRKRQSMPRSTAWSTHAVDELVVLDQAGGIEAAHVDHRLAPEAREGARDEQQPVDLHPRVAGQEVADVLVGLEPLEGAAAERCRGTRG